MTAPLRQPLVGQPTTLDPELTVTVARSLNELMEVMTVRSLVYMAEDDCPYDEEFDGNDFAGATHLILRRGREPVGTLRLRWFPDFVKLERLAIRESHRGMAPLLTLVRAAIQLAEQKGYRKLVGHARAKIAPFWRRYFKARPRQGRAPFVFSDCEYLEMEFELHPPPDAVGLDSDPLVLLRPEGAWDRPGVLDRSAARPATVAVAR